MIKTVLSVIGVDHSDGDLILAIELAREAEAHLAVLVLAISAPPPASEYAAVVNAAWLEERQEDIERLRERVEEVKALLAVTQLSADVGGEYLDRAWIDEAVGHRARCADLTVIGPVLAVDDNLRTPVLKGALYQAQIPVLLVPDGKRPTVRPKRVLVGWDGGLEASRAVHEALPLLAGAEEVHIAMVDPRGREDGLQIEPGADIAAYLARHGVKAVVDRLPSGGQPVADALRTHAVDTAADMIVIGAYGHSRLRDLIFGGVTRSMIGNADLPVFMAR